MNPGAITIKQLTSNHGMYQIVEQARFSSIGHVWNILVDFGSTTTIIINNIPMERISFKGMD